MGEKEIDKLTEKERKRERRARSCYITLRSKTDILRAEGSRRTMENEEGRLARRLLPGREERA